MKKPRFLCIAPYEGMYHLMTNIAAQPIEPLIIPPLLL